MSKKAFKKAQNQFATKEQAKRQDILVWSKEFWRACKWFYKQGSKQAKVAPLKEKATYSAKGLVLGLTWEGVEGMLPLRQITPCGSRSKLQVILDTFLQEQALTGTGDFSKQLGAILVITKQTTIIVNDKPFVNTEVSREFIGDLSAEQMELLDNEMDW